MIPIFALLWNASLGGSSPCFLLFSLNLSLVVILRRMNVDYYKKQDFYVIVRLGEKNYLVYDLKTAISRE